MKFNLAWWALLLIVVAVAAGGYFLGVAMSNKSEAKLAEGAGCKKADGTDGKITNGQCV